MKLFKYSEDDLRNAVKVSKSIGGTLKKLNVAPYGGNYEVFKRAVQYFKIDTSHFVG